MKFGKTFYKIIASYLAVCEKIIFKRNPTYQTQIIRLLSIYLYIWNAALDQGPAKTQKSRPGWNPIFCRGFSQGFYRGFQHAFHCHSINNFMKFAYYYSKVMCKFHDKMIKRYKSELVLTLSRVTSRPDPEQNLRGGANPSKLFQKLSY